MKKSIGNVPVTNFIGQPKVNFEQWLSIVNSKGGNRGVNYIEQAGGDKDNIVSQSITTGHLGVNSTITMTLNTGL